MRFHYVLLVAAATLLARVDGASMVSSVNLPGYSCVGRSLDTEQQHIPAQRFLRTYTTTEDGYDEERAINFNSILGVDKIKTAWTQNKLSTYLKKGKSADDVFAKLKLNKAGDTVFENPKFLAWAKYVDDYNAKPGNKEMSLMPTLTKQYGDDVLAKMLDAALKSKNADTKRIASNLQEQQVKFWRSENLLPADVFTRLRLEGKVDDLLTNPSFFALNRYLVDYNVRYSKSLTMVEVLRGSYGDIALSKMLQAMTKAKDANTNEMAMRLQKQQFELWKDIGLNSDDVFKALRLNKAGVSFESPNFVVWGKFLQNWSGEKTTPFDSLWAKFDEEKLATMLVAPRENVGGTEMVTFLQNKLIVKWLSLERNPNKVSEILGSSFGGKTFAASYRWNFEKKFVYVNTP